jgi:polyisoprenoid-binding protein YceI
MSTQTACFRAAWAVLLTTLALPALAADYQLQPADSRLEFTANQQGADFRGRFERFDAKLSLGDDPSDNRISATIDTASVNTEYQERDEYLVGEEWFNSAEYPQAEFQASGFTPDENGAFDVTAKLTLRGKTRELPMSFRFDGSRLTGSTTMDRRDFGVGMGMWADDDMVSVNVGVEVDVVFAPVD